MDTAFHQIERNYRRSRFKRATKPSPPVIRHHSNASGGTKIYTLEVKAPSQKRRKLNVSGKPACNIPTSTTPIPPVSNIIRTRSGTKSRCGSNIPDQLPPRSNSVKSTPSSRIYAKCSRSRVISSRANTWRFSSAHLSVRRASQISNSTEGESAESYATEIASCHTPSLAGTDRRSSYTSDIDRHSSISQIPGSDDISTLRSTGSCHSIGSCYSMPRRTPVQPERPVLIPLPQNNDNNNNNKEELLHCLPKKHQPTNRSLSADHTCRTPPKQACTTHDLITSFTPKLLAPIELTDFYHDDLEEILADQGSFILEAQQQAKQHRNRLNNLENTRLLEACKKQPLPIKTRRTPEYTVVLDLDETLVHASLTPQPNADCQFDVIMPDSTMYPVYVKLRPGLMEFLERMSENYELVLFTASKQLYAEKLINILDPEKKYIKYRLYRDHCRQAMLNYVKDLSVMARDLAKTVIVDNSPQAFAFHVENGIPIRSWFGDGDDVELAKVANLIDMLCEQSRQSVNEDIRPLVTECFNLQARIDRYNDVVICNEFLDSLNSGFSFLRVKH